ncbi:RNA-directed DNA polymerase from mobile element jockey [Trichonephila clavipes]|nr:RNA-directed DNA polymerase from mobile element jockey [Trichonephila clavipes]
MSGICQMAGKLPPLLDSVVGGGTPGRSFFRAYGSNYLCPCKGLVLPTLNIDTVSALTRYLLISLPNNDMSEISPFTIHKTLIGIGGEPKSVKRLRSGDLLIETTPKLPNTIKAGYLKCKIRPYIPNPLRYFKCQRFGHSQTSCRDQLTRSRCASVRHSSTDCTLEPKCINSAQSHSSDSKLCQKWKLEKQIQEIKTNRNISFFEARKLIVPQLTQTYAQATKPSTISTTTQTDPNITNIICPPLQYLKPVSSENPMPSTSSSVSTVSTSS